MERVRTFYQAHQQEFIHQATDRLLAAQLPTYSNYSREEILERVFIPGHQAFSQEFIMEIQGAFAAYMSRIGTLRAQQHGQIADILHVLQASFAVMTEAMSVAFADQPTTLVWWHETMHPIIWRATISMAEHFTVAREHMWQLIHTQKNTLDVVHIAEGVGILVGIDNLQHVERDIIFNTMYGAITDRHVCVLIIDLQEHVKPYQPLANHLEWLIDSGVICGINLLLVHPTITAKHFKAESPINSAGVHWYRNMAEAITHSLTHMRSQQRGG